MKNVSLSLSPREASYLREAEFLSAEVSQELWRLLDETRHPELSPTLARMLGDALTHRLASCGFDEAYRITDEGDLLEAILDRLGLGSEGDA